MVGPIIVTGAAGFIGAAFVEKLLDSDNEVIGIDNLNKYYDVNLKKKRLEKIRQLSKNKNVKWSFYQLDIENKKKLHKIFRKYSPGIVVHLAAQAGVRYSLKNPEPYISTNINGFFNILEECKEFSIKNFIYASSSSVYGGNTKLPFREDDLVDHPLSLYAATKKSNELLAHSYSHLFNIPSTGLRFFTVYGPWGRPDMAPMIFAKAMLTGNTIKVFNYGKMLRDFTYIDDVVDAIFKCCFKPATGNKLFNSREPIPSTSLAPHRIFNIGNSKPFNLMDFIDLLEKELDVKVKKEFFPLQQGDVTETYAGIDLIKNWVDFEPKTSLEDGIRKFAKWYKNFYLF